MAKRILLSIGALIALLIIFDGCSSGKSSYESGNYYQAVITAVSRLRKNVDHKKSAETLRNAYPLAVSYYDDKAKESINSNGQFKWTAVVEHYTTINSMYEEIKRSPGALKVIPNPVNYYSKLTEAKQHAAEENYAAGILALAEGSRDQAKYAYTLFQKSDGFVSGYKDVQDMMETARWNATVKVLMEPIPVQAQNISVSATFFDDKVSEFLHSTNINQFVKFYTRAEAETINLTPDQIIQIQFDDFAVGQVYMHEKEIMCEKDSIVAGIYVAESLTGGNTGGKGGAGGNSGGNTGGSGSGNTGGGTTGGTGGTGDTSGGVTGGGTTGGGTGNSGGTDNSGNTGGSGNGNTGGATGGGASGNTGGSGNPTADSDTVKVVVCHVPGGDLSKSHSLTISRSALKAHLAHGDTEGNCGDKKDPKAPKGGDKPKGGGNGGEEGFPLGMTFTLTTSTPVIASAGSDPFKWLSYAEELSMVDTTKIYMKVKATLYYYKKTTTSKGIINFRIIDAKTNALLSVEKMPGEFVWISEWATFNGDERALTVEQIELSKLKEQVPPSPQDLFIEFTRPIYNQVTSKIKDFYTGY